MRVQYRIHGMQLWKRINRTTYSMLSKHIDMCARGHNKCNRRGYISLVDRQNKKNNTTSLQLGHDKKKMLIRIVLHRFRIVFSVNINSLKRFSTFHGPRWRKTTNEQVVRRIRPKRTQVPYVLCNGRGGPDNTAHGRAYIVFYTQTRARWAAIRCDG